MTDYEKLKGVFEEIGVDFKETTPDFIDNEVTSILGHDGTVTCDKQIHLKNGVGYYRFECDFYFLDGKYQGHGVWE